MVGTQPVPDAQEWLASTARTDLLRFSTAGSVDDGKSTLIGRLLYDSKGVYEDQLASVRKATKNQTTGGLDLSLLTDGLRAEREQGITIDVAYRYFSTPRRKFIIADTPGHEQYTRNMATGASTADLAIILVDARLGVLSQSRRHTYIATLLGIPNIVVAINKMDLVDFREDVFTAIRTEFEAFTTALGVHNLQFIPVSALDGDNVVHRSRRTPWYDGPPLLEHLETVPLAQNGNLSAFRFPVQYVIRPDLDFRGFAGQIASGVVRRGDLVTVLPSGRTSRIKSIVTWDGELEEAFAPMSVTLCLEDELDISRGDMLVHPGSLPHVERRFEAAVVWMNAQPFRPDRPYLLKHTTQTVQARGRSVQSQINVNTLAETSASGLNLNEIGVVSIEAQRPLYFDPYRRNRATGAFILIDPITSETVGAGMIRQAEDGHTATGRVTTAERQLLFGHTAFVLCVPPSRLDLAVNIERLLYSHGCATLLLDSLGSDSVRVALSAGLITIVAPQDDEGTAFVRSIVPSGQLVFVPNIDGLWQRLESESKVGIRQNPYEDGSGI